MSTFPTALQDDTFVNRADETSAGGQICAELTDRQLVDSVLSGNINTFEQIFDRHKRTVAITAARFFRKPEQIEEMIQISFTKAYSELGRFRGEHEASLGSWLSRIAANACLDAIRSERRKPENLNCELSDGESATLLDLAANNDRSVEDDLTVRDLSAKLLAELPDDDRALLHMFYVEEISVAEIAVLLGWSRSKVKIRAWRARNSLRRILGRYL